MPWSQLPWVECLSLPCKPLSILQHSLTLAVPVTNPGRLRPPHPQPTPVSAPRAPPAWTGLQGGLLPSSMSCWTQRVFAPQLQEDSLEVLIEQQPSQYIGQQETDTKQNRGLESRLNRFSALLRAGAPFELFQQQPQQGRAGFLVLEWLPLKSM